MSFEQIGRVIHLGAVETFGEKNFPKCTVVINNEDDEYPEDIPFTFAGKKAEAPKMAGIKEGDKVSVHFEPKGREWQGKWFAEHAAWKIERHGATRNKKEAPAFDPNQEILDEEPPF